jgi:hypothetical protein
MAAEFRIVEVLNKTQAVFVRDNLDHKSLTNKLNPKLKELLDANSVYHVTLKTDGSCGAIIKIDNKYVLCKRQDINNKSRNFEQVTNPANGKLCEIAGLPCYLTSIIRGTGPHEREEPLYIFQLTKDGIPELESNHLIGFTPVLNNFPDDKYMVTAIDSNILDSNCNNWNIRTTWFDGSLNIHVIKIPISQFMRDKQIKTVEIMCKKISDKYSYQTDECFVNPHGSIVIPQNLIPEFNYNFIKTWFENDTFNDWANQEGFVIHFPYQNMRFKLHRGHVGMEESWQIKKECGIKFIFE